MTETADITRKEALALLKTNMAIIKENISIKMKEKKWHQKDLAFYANTSPQFISYFLRRKGNCTIEFLGRLAHILDTTISELAKK